jgi:hypothetical protein
MLHIQLQGYVLDVYILIVKQVKTSKQLPEHSL